MLEIRDLRHLISIDEFRHFGRASAAVGLSQPALTKSLQRIERSLGAKLFDRSRAGVAPTEIGKEVLVRARQLVEQATELQRTVDSITNATLGTVTIGIGPAMSETFLTDAIASTVQRHPGIQITVRVDHWQQLSKWLLVGDLDFYVADIGDAVADNRFQVIRLPPQDIVWFCRPSHPLAGQGKRTVSRGELLRFPLATPKMPPWGTEWFAAACGEKGTVGLPRPFPAVECESYSMLKRIVTSSDCIGGALRQTLVRELASGELVALPVDAPQIATHAGIVRRSHHASSALAMELIASIERVANSTMECRT